MFWKLSKKLYEIWGFNKENYLKQADFQQKWWDGTFGFSSIQKITIYKNSNPSYFHYSYCFFYYFYENSTFFLYKIQLKRSFFENR